MCSISLLEAIDRIRPLKNRRDKQEVKEVEAIKTNSSEV